MKTKKPNVEAMLHHDNDDNLVSEECWDAGEHTAVSRATVNYGRDQRTDVTELCIFCNVKLRTWQELPDNFVFTE